MTLTLTLAGRKSLFFLPNLHSTAPLVSPGRNIVITFGTEKLERRGYPTVKNF